MTGLKTRIETPYFQESISFYVEHLGMTVLHSWEEVGDTGVIWGSGLPLRVKHSWSLPQSKAPRPMTESV